MVKKMKKINNYFKSYNGSDCRLDFLRFGLFNERGSFIDTCPKKIANLEELNKIDYKASCKQIKSTH